MSRGSAGTFFDTTNITVPLGNLAGRQGRNGRSERRAPHPGRDTIGGIPGHGRSSSRALRAASDSRKMPCSGGCGGCDDNHCCRDARDFDQVSALGVSALAAGSTPSGRSQEPVPASAAGGGHAGSAVGLRSSLAGRPLSGHLFLHRRERRHDLVLVAQLLVLRFSACRLDEACDRLESGRCIVGRDPALEDGVRILVVEHSSGHVTGRSRHPSGWRYNAVSRLSAGCQPADSPPGSGTSAPSLGRHPDAGNVSSSSAWVPAATPGGGAAAPDAGPPGRRRGSCRQYGRRLLRRDPRRRAAGRSRPARV